MEISVPSLVRIKRNAMLRIGKYCRDLQAKNIALFWGGGLQPLFESRVLESFAEYKITVSACFENDSASVDALFGLYRELPGDIDTVVAIGGGRVIDGCKYIAHAGHKKLLVCPTIVSNDGFCSSLSSLLFQDDKKTVKTMLPHGVVVDLEVLQSSPQRFFYSGVGDLVSNLTALWDWKLAYHRAGTYVDDFAVVLSQTAAENFINLPVKQQSDQKSLSVLANGLLLSGIAMEVAGSSRPASGSEHLISHAYDMHPAAQKSSHGLQVGVAALAMSVLQKDTFEPIKMTLQESGFLDYMKENPLDRSVFQQSIIAAPTMKNDFHTLLAESEHNKKLLDICESHELFSDLLI